MNSPYLNTFDHADAAKENVTPLPEYDVFKDASFQKKGEAKAAGSTDQSNVSACFVLFFPTLL